MKTTIAISKESRKNLQKIKIELERERKHFIDMDEIIGELISFYIQHHNSDEQ